MNLWLQAIYLIASSKKGISSNQLHRTLGVNLKTAWFMHHRIREAMRFDNSELFGRGGGDVKVDETFNGKDATRDPKRRKADTTTSAKCSRWLTGTPERLRAW